MKKHVWLCKLPVMILAAAIMMSMLSGCQQTEESVSVQSVSMLMGLGSVGTSNRFPGLVTSGKTESIQKDESMSVDEICVEVGQDVKTGDLLFTYDNAALLLTLEQMRLEIEGMKNSLTTKNEQIADLEKQRDNVSESNKLGYTLQIESLQADIRETEYNISLKEKELETKEAESQKTEVYAPFTGRITEINEDGGTDNYGNPKAFMTIVETGNLQIKGTINEMNANSLWEGTRVIIRSRVSDEVWTGTISLIDWGNPVTNNNNNYYYYSSDEMTTSSKYPFYVALDTEEGLFVGQHVYIEAGELTESDDTVRLASYFVVDPEGDAYVWAENAGGKLEKRKVVLGEYDEMMGEYVISSGLALTDFVAFPEDTLKEGMIAVEYDSTMLDGGMNDGYYEGDMGYTEDGVDFGDMNYEDMVDEEITEE